MDEPYRETHHPLKVPAILARRVHYLVLAFVATTILGLVRGKLTALLIGPPGVSLYAQASNLLQMGAVLGSLGLGLCIVREVAAAASEDDYSRQHLVLRTALALQAVAVSAVLLSGLLGAGPLARWAFQRDWLAITVVVLGGVPFVVGTIVAGSVLQGRGAVRLYSGALASGALANTITVSLGAWLAGTEGAILGLVLGGVVTLAVHLLACRKLTQVTDASATRWLPIDRKVTGLLLTFGAATLVNGFVEIGAQLVLRRSLMKLLGEFQTGIFQAGITVSAQSGGLFTLLLGATLFPALSKCRTTGQVRGEVADSLNLTLTLLMPLLLGLTLARDIIAPTLFSSAFGALSPLIPVLAIADFFRIATWPLSYPVLARGAVKTHVVVVCVLNSLLAVLPALGARSSGLVGAAWGQAAAVFAGFVGVVLLQGFSVGLWLHPGLVIRLARDFLLLVLAASPVLFDWPSPVGFGAALLWGGMLVARPADRLALWEPVRLVCSWVTSRRGGP